MNQTEILASLQEVFDSLFVESVKVSPQLSAHDVKEWDSLAHITLVFTIEKKFSIRFRVGEVESAKNIGELIELIEKKM